MTEEQKQATEQPTTNIIKTRIKPIKRPPPLQFFGGASSSVMPSSVSKSAISIDEKKPSLLQKKLIAACENGNLNEAKKMLEQGAKPDLPDENGKNPIYSAAWGMNPELVAYLLEHLGKNVDAINWQKCSEHNNKHYGKLFLNLQFDPKSCRDWFDLITEIEHNQYLVNHHLNCLQSLSEAKNISSLKRWLQIELSTEEENSIDGWFHVNGSGTDEGFAEAREQIKQYIESVEQQQKNENNSVFI